MMNGFRRCLIWLQLPPQSEMGAIEVVVEKWCRLWKVIRIEYCCAYPRPSR